MASSRVISARFPYVPVTVTVGNRAEDFEALLDTGFDGFVIVPAGLLTNGVPPDGRLQYFLADGSPIIAPLFRGTVSVGPFGPYPTVITVLEDEAIIGRRLTARFTVTLDHSDRVIIEA
jgi:predicted aspartyl protease